MSKYPHGDLSWFRHDRFGMFIHWGLYALPARHEWIKSREKISEEDYQRYFDHYNPDLFDPKAWARAAREAGMKYFVFTAKHHEGFCNFDSKFTDYKVTNTAFKRDVLREVIDAFRAEGLHVGVYYSLIDWHHPDFTIDCHHPMRELPKEEIERLNQPRDMKRYAEYMRNQVTEILTNYGKIDILWFDYSYPRPTGDGKDHNDWESEKLLKLIRTLQPHVIIDNRLDLPGSGDIVTPEQYTPANAMTDEEGNPTAWEGCQTFSGAWGYHRDEYTWKSAKQCIDMLVNHVSRDGNLLMNVGPTARGYLDSRALTRLADFGEWMKYNNRAIYGCGQAPAEFAEPADCRYTYNPATRRLYCCILNWPFKFLMLPGLTGKIEYAQFLHDASEIQYTQFGSAIPEAYHMALAETNCVRMLLPAVKPPVEVPVIEIFLK